MNKSKNKNKNIKLTQFILYFFLLASLFLTYLMSKNFIRSVSGNIKSVNWIQVDAKLLNASIKTTKGSRSSSSSTQYTYFTPQISYEYNFKDVNCISSKVAWVESGDTGPLKELAYKFKYHFKHKKLIRVFVNPNKLCESVADRSIHWSKLMATGIMFFITAFFAIGIVYLLIKTSKK
ncbi:MAG: DUF3592 domain-containing protein [Cognaticolwellia sp.]